MNDFDRNMGSYLDFSFPWLQTEVAAERSPRVRSGTDHVFEFPDTSSRGLLKKIDEKRGSTASTFG
jgi:hypothetical protein